MEAQLLSVKQVGQICQLSGKTVRKLIAAGALPSVRTGFGLRVDRRKLEEWIESGGTLLRGEAKVA